MLIKRKFLLATLLEAAILSGCACGKANVQQQEKSAQAEVKPQAVQVTKPAAAESVPVAPVVMDTVQAKKILMEAKGIVFREGWPKLATGMTVDEIARLLGSDLGLGYCKGQQSYCTWTPKLSYYGYPDLKGDVTFKFNAGKLTEWTPKDLPPKE